MKNRMSLVAVLGIFFLFGIFSGISTADQLKFTYPMSGTDPYAGQVNFITNPAGEFEWGYCIEKDIYSNWNTWYTYELKDITGYYGATGKPNLGLIAADLIWKQYSDGSVSGAEKTALQNKIWDVFNHYGNYSGYVFTYSAALLENLFDIAFVPNVSGWGQDFIVYNPVPEPVSMLLFGAGLVSIGGYVRKKFKK